MEDLRRNGIILFLLLLITGLTVFILLRLTSRPPSFVADQLCSPQSPDLITFEAIPGVTDPTEAVTAINNQFAATHSVRFSNGRRLTAGGEDLGACPIPHPVLAKVGNPNTAYTSQKLNNTGDGVLSAFAAQTGSWFLTDDGQDGVGIVPCALVIDFDKPTHEFSFDLLDVDDGESWRTIAYDQAGTQVYFEDFSSPSSQYDSMPYRIEIPYQAAQITKVVVMAASRKPAGGWGLAFDNFSPSCADIDVTSSSTTTVTTPPPTATSTTIMTTSTATPEPVTTTTSITTPLPATSSETTPSSSVTTTLSTTTLTSISASSSVTTATSTVTTTTATSVPPSVTTTPPSSTTQATSSPAVLPVTALIDDSSDRLLLGIVLLILGYLWLRVMGRKRGSANY